MMNKILARDSFYKQGSSNYVWLLKVHKVEKDDEEDNLLFSSLVYDKWVFSEVAKSGTIFSRNYVKW